MKLFLVIIAIFINGTVWGADVVVDKNKINQGMDSAKEFLSDPKARSSGEIDPATTSFLNQWRSTGMTHDMKSLAGENDGLISNMQGDKSVDGKIGCIGNTKIASILFSSGGGFIDMNIKPEFGSSINISKIKGICSAGFTVCDNSVNESLCAQSISRASEASKQGHSCVVFKNDICRSWQPLILNKTLIFEPLGEACSVLGVGSAESYNSLTGLISGAFSKGGFPIGKIDTENNISVIYSMQSENCIMGDYGSGLTNMDDLNSLYNSKAVTMPDSTEAMQNAAKDNDSIYNLVMKGNSVEFNGGASIGQLSVDKCEINNQVNTNIIGTEKKDTFSGSYKFCTDHVINSRIRYSGTQLLIEFRGGNGSSDNMQGCYSWPGANEANSNGGWFSVYSVSAPSSLKNAILTYSVTGDGCDKGDGSFSITGASSNNLICGAAGIQYPQIDWKLDLIYSEDKMNVELISSNSCQSQEANGECSINNEWICDNQKSNCIQTVQDGKKLSVNLNFPCYDAVYGSYNLKICPTGNSFNISGPLGTFSLVSDNSLGWSNIQREYLCASKPSGIEDVSKGLEDIFGVLGDNSGNIKLPNTCYVQFCTVSKRYNTNNIYGSGETNESIGNSASVSQKIKQCSSSQLSSGMKFSCPTDADEMITEDCSCNNKSQLVTNLSEVLIGFAMAEELKKYLDCDNSTEKAEGNQP